MSTFLERIKTSGPRTPVAVPTPEWDDLDGAVYVRRLTALQRAELYAALEQHKALRGAAFSAFLVAYCACNSAQERYFDDADYEPLMQEPATVIDRLSEAADDLNVISETARERQKKTFAAAQRSGNTSASPDNAA